MGYLSTCNVQGHLVHLRFSRKMQFSKYCFFYTYDYFSTKRFAVVAFYSSYMLLGVLKIKIGKQKQTKRLKLCNIVATGKCKIANKFGNGYLYRTESWVLQHIWRGLDFVDLKIFEYFCSLISNLVSRNICTKFESLILTANVRQIAKGQGHFVSFIL